jgi:hypothetical protein
MRVCPKCGYAENPLWQQSRFCANYSFMRKEDFQTEYPETFESLQKTKEHTTQVGNFIYRISKRSPYVKRLEVVGGSTATNYEQNRLPGSVLSINKWVIKQNALRSKSQTKLLEIEKVGGIQK